MADDTNKKKEVWRAVKFVLFSISAGVIEISVFALLLLRYVINKKGRQI